MLLVHALAGQKETVTGQASVTFHCPVCGARDVEATALDTEYTIKLLHLIPVSR